MAPNGTPQVSQCDWGKGKQRIAGEAANSAVAEWERALGMVHALGYMATLHYRCGRYKAVASRVSRGVARSNAQKKPNMD